MHKLRSVLTLSLLCVPLAVAQFDSGAILGTVRDPKGAAIASAKVTAQTSATGITSSATTDASGDCIFPSLQIGDYRVTAEMQGFSTGVAETVNLTVNARQRVDLTLQVGSVSETITVTEVTPLLETESSSRGQ